MRTRGMDNVLDRVVQTLSEPGRKKYQDETKFELDV
jgi:hypothetical protein